MLIHCYEFLALIVSGGIQVVNVGAIALRIHATKRATFRCKLDDREFVICRLF